MKGLDDWNTCGVNKAKCYRQQFSEYRDEDDGVVACIWTG